MATPLQLRYWAKSPRDPSLVYHPVAYHCLDVAAAARCILDIRPKAARRLAHVSGVPEPGAGALVVLLLAYHDLGKLADGFQGLLPELMERLQGSYREAAYDTGIWKHDSVGQAILCELVDAGSLGLPSTSKPSVLRNFKSTWLSAAMGHHGRPTVVDARKYRDLSRQFPDPVRADLETIVADLQSFLLPQGIDPSWFEDEEAARAASWLITGLAVNADWIGSSQTWFPPVEACHTLANYFAEVALPRARAAAKDAGLAEPRSASSVSFQGLWPGFVATPLQVAADQLAFDDGPQLFIVEEVTGGGKTEAAFALAHRLIAAGKAEGLYIALPTMATANAMYHRLEAAYRKLFEDAEPASLILAHARRDLHLAGLERAAGQDEGGPDGPETAGGQCAAWLADSRKKSLLADVGIGTIDQALLAILQNRHQALRLWGLSSKVLVVDEVHAADPYVLELLSHLLETHAAFGGQAILLSATLAASQRQILAGAFARGAQREEPEFEVPAPYPCLTHLTRTSTRALALAARAEASRRIAVVLTDNLDELERRIVATIDQGGCACWIRNTVGDAREAASSWASRLPAGRVHLFHSRFTVDDRERVERDVLRRFGPKSGPAERAGHLLIATQVVEQSLDLDFDTLITDLAPIDLLIQRAGRLRRHRRQRDGNRHEAADERGTPELMVYGPLPLQDASKDWFESFLPGAAFVYPDHGRLWLGSAWLVERTSVDIPADLRALIEHVYGDDAFERMPDGLVEHHDRVDGTSRASRTIASDNAISFSNGYAPQKMTDSWRDDVRVPTRLGEDSAIVRLARLHNGRIVPWHTDGDHCWERSEVRVAARLVANGSTCNPALLAPVLGQLPDKGKWSTLVILEAGEPGWVGTAPGNRGSDVTITYNTNLGLTVSHNNSRSSTPRGPGGPST